MVHRKWGNLEVSQVGTFLVSASDHLSTARDRLNYSHILGLYQLLF